jgi:amyloid beta precursor protein binding protein 1
MQSVGFYSHFSIAYPTAFTITDTHPDPVTVSDLRLTNPWPELADYAAKKTADLDKMDDHAHGHVPWLLLILHFLDQWKKINGKLPETFKEKIEFRKFIMSHARISSSSGVEENFEQAAAAVVKHVKDPNEKPSKDIMDIWWSKEASEYTAESPDFWLLAHAVNRFWEKEGHTLPLSGTLPDMKAQSDDYIELQNFYKAKAKSDIQLVLVEVRTIEANLPNRTLPPISESEVELFCKNARNLKLLRSKAFDSNKTGGEPNTIEEQIEISAKNAGEYIIRTRVDIGLNYENSQIPQERRRSSVAVLDI